MGDTRLRFWIGPVALILAGLLLGTVRPALRFENRTHGSHATHRPVLVADATDFGEVDVQLTALSRAPSGVAVPALVLGLLVHLVLGLRRIASVPVTIRRLKLPPSRDDSVPLL